MNNNAMAANTVHYQYTTEISQMMFVFGEVQEPLEETCFLVEDIARNQVPCVSLFDSYAAIPFLCRLHPHSFINLLSSHANLRLSLANSIDFPSLPRFKAFSCRLYRLPSAGGRNL